MKKKVIVTIVIGIVMILGLAALFLSGSFVGAYLQYRNHWSVQVEETEFVESDKELHNPNRGFYTMTGFMVSDEESMYQHYQQMGTQIAFDPNALSLVEINLMKYSEGPITDAGLENIRSIFRALSAMNKQYIVRFLYDWDGKAIETEPEDVQIILKHMQQLEEILEEYKKIIFAFQGIFVGACGEMHSTNHMTEESMQLLMQQLMKVTPKETFLSVRTPQLWRSLTGYSNGTDLQFSELSCRLGLFNDGMMGTELDCGTYGTGSKTELGVYQKWTAEEELAFQEELCSYVPNGGEVIVDNPVNDLENALQRMRTMHVTYLNQNYDKMVLDKWAASTVTEEGCFYGMDGLSYVNRMLGYRLLIDQVSLDYDFCPDKLNIEIRLKNVGFAPLYKEPEKYILIYHKETGELQSYPLEAELRSLAGGNKKEQVLSVAKELSLAGFAQGEYEVYFSVKDTDSGWHIELANEQKMQKLGYLVGSFKVGALKNPFTGEKVNLKEKLEDVLTKIEE